MSFEINNWLKKSRIEEEKEERKRKTNKEEGKKNKYKNENMLSINENDNDNENYNESDDESKNSQNEKKEIERIKKDEKKIMETLEKEKDDEPVLVTSRSRLEVERDRMALEIVSEKIDLYVLLSHVKSDEIMYDEINVNHINENNTYDTNITATHNNQPNTQKINDSTDMNKINNINENTNKNTDNNKNSNFCTFYINKIKKFFAVIPNYKINEWDYKKHNNSIFSYTDFWAEIIIVRTGPFGWLGLAGLVIDDFYLYF